MKVFITFGILTLVFAFQARADVSASSPEAISNPSPGSAPAPKTLPADANPGPPEWRFAVGGGFAIGGNARWLEVKTNGGTGQIGGMDFGSALDLVVETRYTRPDAWGLIVGASVGNAHKARKETLAGTSVDSDATLMVGVLSADLVYQWTHWYVPIGFNLAGVKFTPDTRFGGTTDARGGTGFEIGVGYLIDDRWSLEALSRGTTIVLTTESSTGQKTEYGYGTFSTLVTTVKYAF